MSAKNQSDLTVPLVAATPIDPEPPTPDILVYAEPTTPTDDVRADARAGGGLLDDNNRRDHEDNNGDYERGGDPLRVVREGNHPVPDDHSIPRGRWRDGLCSCCTLGCCHPVLCAGIWCFPIVLGQVMTRLSFDWTGRVVDSSERRRHRDGSGRVMSGYVAMLSIAMLYWFWNIFSRRDCFKARDFGNYSIVLCHGGLMGLVSVVLAIYVILMTKTVRNYVRRRYSIPQGLFCCCCEDLCCSIFCFPLVHCQLARHTADYRTYDGQCCSPTGLYPDAPAIIV